MHMPEPTDLDRMMATLDPRDPFGLRDRLMLGLARQTGLRVAELTGLDVNDVALEGCPRETLVVRAAIAKGGRSRIVPLNQTAREAVVGILRFNEARGFSVAPEAPLLVNRYHRRLSVRCVQLLVQALREKAGLDVRRRPTRCGTISPAASWRPQATSGLPGAPGPQGLELNRDLRAPLARRPGPRGQPGGVKPGEGACGRPPGPLTG